MYSLRPSTVTPRRAVRPAPLVCQTMRSHHLSRLMHYLGARGRAKLSSWPSRSWMWK